MDTKTSISAAEALAEIKANPNEFRTPDALRALADRVSVVSSGRITILYSGPLGMAGVPTNDFVEALNRQGLDTRNINKTELSALLNDPIYRQAAADAFGESIKDIADRSSKSNRFLEDPIEGEWARGSARFSVASQGDVRIFGAFAPAERTMNLVEVDRLMSSAEVTKINGIEKTVFQKVYDTSLAESAGNIESARSALLESIKFSSSELMKEVRISGAGDTLRVGTGGFFQGTEVADVSLPSELISESRRFGSIYGSVGSPMTPAEISDWGRGANNLAVAAEAVMGERIATAGLKLMARGGAILGAAYTAARSIELVDAIKSGDNQKATAISKELAAFWTGGLAGSSAAFTAAASTLSPLLSAGPIGAACFLALTGASALVGGYWGAKAAESMIDTVLNGMTNGNTGQSQVRIDEIWVATDLGNGSRLLSVSPADANAVVLMANGVYSKLEIPDGHGGYTQIATGTNTTEVSAWSGAPGANGSTLVKRVVRTQSEAGVSVKNFVGTQLVSETVTSQVTVDGHTYVKEITNLGDGTATSRTLDTDGQIYRRSETQRQADGSSVTQEFDKAGFLLATTARKTYDDGSFEETVTTATGTVKNTHDSDGVLVKAEKVEDGLANLNNAAGGIRDFLSLVKALQDGKPLPIVVAGVNMLSTLDKAATNGYGAYNLTLGGAANALGGINSLASLSAAWKQGDATGVFSAGASALYYGGTAYANMLGYANIGAAAAQGAVSTGVANAVGMAGQAMPYLGIVNSLAHGDVAGAAIGAVSMIPGMQWVGVVYGIISMFKSPPEPWGNGKFVFNDDGTIRIQADGGDGGLEPVRNMLQNLQSSLQAIVAQYNQAAPGAQIGLVAGRLGGLSFRNGQWTLTTLDPETGAQRVLHYDSNGKVQDAPLGSPEYFRGMGEQYIYSALQSQAIAAGWEVRTAMAQSKLGDPMAGLSETQRAQRGGQYLGADHRSSVGANSAQGTPGAWRVIGLDLGGDGVQTVSQAASNVVFDVDGTGFAKHTAWVGKQDGMLVLDRNFNGVVDSGAELFGNTEVALGAQGLKGLAWVDANADGDISSQDAVYSELRVWQDANGNGLVDTGEAKSLAEMGISRIHYNRGSYERGAQTLQMVSVDLAVDSVGTRVDTVPGGIRIESSNGKVSVLVTKTADLSNLAPGNDGVQGLEDTQLDMLASSLLANDKVLGQNKNLSVTAVGSARHGTVWLDAAGLHFLGEKDYAGKDAGFSYTVKDAGGNTAQASVTVELAGVNDAPTVQAGYTRTAIYGYVPDSDGNLTALFSPGWGCDANHKRFTANAPTPGIAQLEDWRSSLFMENILEPFRSPDSELVWC